MTFRPDVASQAHELDFITLQHPLVGTLLELEPDVLRPVAALRAPAKADGVRRLAFFVYLLNIHSFKRGLEFLPVAVELGGNVDEQLSDELLLLIHRSDLWERDDLYPDESELEPSSTLKYLQRSLLRSQI